MASISNKRYTIAIMLGDTQSDYSEDLLRGFYSCAKAENVNIVFLMGPQTPQYCTDILSCSVNGNYNYQFDTIYDYVHFTKPDALIIIYGSLSIFSSHDEQANFLAQYADIPYLLLEDIPEHSNAPFLIADNYGGMRMCIEHLIFIHHYKKITFLSGPRNNKDANERLQAYYDVMSENHLPVTDKMVTFGNYSELVNDQVKYLLDCNPDIEAIACANDNMAKSAYRVCAARDLIVGHDVAITGFDDVELAQTMDPPLSSVSHNSFQFSYTALKNAIALCEGEVPASQRMPTIFHQRCSCGCPSNQALSFTKVSMNDMQFFIDTSAHAIADDILSGIPYKRECDLYTQLMINFFQYIYTTVLLHGGNDFRLDYLIGILKQFVSYPHISGVLLLKNFTNLLRVLISNAQNDKIRGILSNIISTLQQYIHTHEILVFEKEIIDSNRKAWFVPSFTRDLISSSDELKDTMFNIIHRLKLMHVKSSYFYFFDRPIIHKEDSPLYFPPEMKLVAFHNRNECTYYDPARRPVVTYQNGFSSFLSSKHQGCLTSFVLFSGEEQYGLLLCEVEQKDISFMQICSLQLGSLFRFIELNVKELHVQKELQKSLNVIQEQNHILSFISEYDELSQLLNRRGFMERALKACNKEYGKKAYLLFGDLDHLKEINDCFGHTAGDFAIRTIADRLRKCLPSNSITARIGGDEFISFIETDQIYFKDTIVEIIKKESDAFNIHSGKPYYIECSIGMYEFYCNPQIDLDKIIQKADEMLYTAKIHRRASVKKKK